MGTFGAGAGSCLRRSSKHCAAVPPTSCCRIERVMFSFEASLQMVVVLAAGLSVAGRSKANGTVGQVRLPTLNMPFSVRYSVCANKVLA